MRQAFDADLLRLLADSDYVVLTAVIDKLEHRERYTVWHFDPYHYCLTALVERFALWLRRRGATGDVLAESRGGREDRRLKRAFERIYSEGTSYVPAETFAAYLTSRQLKVKPKNNNIAGLQLADLIAHPSFRAMLARRRGEELPTNFGGRIAAILEASKYDRSRSGKPDGWGCKWLP